MIREMFSPPTRGWPAFPVRESSGIRVFPAHAGMARGNESH